MRLTELIVLSFISTLAFGQDRYVGFYKNRFSESIELRSDSTFTHKWSFDLASSWTTGKWKVKNDTVYLKTELVLDTLLIRNTENIVVKDSLVLSSDQRIDRIEQRDFIGTNLSSSGQNRHKPPDKVYWKRKKLYRIKVNGKLDLRRLKAFWLNKKYRTFFRKESD